MLRVAVACTAGLVMLIAYASPSEACGIKLTAGSPNVERQQRSENPSQILLVGSPPRRLARELSNAGHSVHIAESPAEAQRTNYPVVLADEEHVDEANQRFAGSQVVERQGSRSRDVAQVESSLQRAPVDSAGRRIAARGRGGDRQAVESGRGAGGSQARQPRETGGAPDDSGSGASGEERQPADAARGSSADEPTASESAPDRAAEREEAEQRAAAEREAEQRAAAEREAEREAARAERAEQREREASDRDDRVAMRDDDSAEDGAGEPAVQRDEPTRSPQPDAASAQFHEEIRFGTSSARLGAGAQERMRETAAWLNENDGVSIVIVGHTNTPGNSDYNMQLSQRRAEQTRDFLVSQGVDSSRIEVEWRGEDEPAYGDGVDGRNRRVELSR